MTIDEVLIAGRKEGYNKAIDNFANLIKQRKFDYIEQCLEFDDFIDILAKQLKEGGENE